MRQIPVKNRLAFVCSGGAVKAGAFHLGVALALQERGFGFQGGLKGQQSTPYNPHRDIQVYVGSSAGALITSFLAAGYPLESIFASFLKKAPPENLPSFPRLTYQTIFKLAAKPQVSSLAELKLLKNFVSSITDGNLQSLLRLRWIKMNGLFNTSGIEQYLREEVLPTNQFNALEADLFTVATQLDGSHKVVFGKYALEPPPHDPSCTYSNTTTISNAVAASTALPPVFAPHAIEDEHGESTWYFDGEIRDTLSTHVAVDAGADLIFASYTHQPYHYDPKVGSLSSKGLPSIILQALFLLIEQKIKNGIFQKEKESRAIEKVEEYLETSKIAEPHRSQILSILERELHHKRNVDIVYIHPNPNDHRMFFKENFSLSPHRMQEIVRSGYRSAMSTLSELTFE